MAELEASGRRTRKDSVESLVRHFIQKQKIDMANEVIDAGRFDMQTSMDERRATLEALLQVGVAGFPPQRHASRNDCLWSLGHHLSLIPQPPPVSLPKHATVPISPHFIHP